MYWVRAIFLTLSCSCLYSSSNRMSTRIEFKDELSGQICKCIFKREVEHQVICWVKSPTLTSGERPVINEKPKCLTYLEKCRERVYRNTNNHQLTVRRKTNDPDLLAHLNVRAYEKNLCSLSLLMLSQFYFYNSETSLNAEHCYCTTRCFSLYRASVCFQEMLNSIPFNYNK